MWVGELVRDVELRHGYTLWRLNGLAVFAARRGHFHQAADFSDRVETAWSAMAVFLYESPVPPPVGDVVVAGWRAIDEWVRSERRFRGWYTQDHYAGTRHNFARYWWSAAGLWPGVEERVIERVALWQIWGRMRPVHRDVLGALAVCADHRRAAEALGKSRSTFATQLVQARREFLRLWHEGEHPSRPWGPDRRRSATSSDRHPPTYVIRQRRRRRATGGPPKSNRRGRRSGLLDAAGVRVREVAARYDSGESVQQLANSFEVSYAVMRAWMDRNGIERRSAGRQLTPHNGVARTDIGISADDLTRRYHGNGESIRKIAADLNVAPSTVHHFMRRKGITRRKPGTPPGRKASRSNQTNAGGPGDGS